MTTWYVRPASYVSGANNGTSYADAWQGWTNIVAASMAATDTLMVCGAHSYSTNPVLPKAGTSLSAPFVVDGGYASDPGSISLTSTALLSCNKNYVTIQNLGITESGTSTAIAYVSGTISGLTLSACTITGGGVGSGISFDSGDGKSYSDITITGCTFAGDFRQSSTASGAIHWFISTAAATNTMTRLTITNNTFSDCIAGRAQIHCRMQNNVNVASKMTDVIVSGNTFVRCNGTCIELNSGFATVGQSSGLKIQNNLFYSCSTSPVNGGGGCIFVQGFTPSASAGFGVVDISQNKAINVDGAVGFADLLYGSYSVHDNKCDTLTTSTIDGVGVLFDLGCTNSFAYANSFKNLPGSASADNSGAGIMVLASTGIGCWGNVVENCKVGIHIGDAGSAQSCLIFNNSFLNCSSWGVYLRIAADRTNSIVKNNVFTASSGAAYSVYDLSVNWTNEDYNIFYSFPGASGHTLGTHSLTSNPALSSSGAPSSASPAVAAGVFTEYCADAMGNAFWNPPSIGAYEYIRPRTART